MRNLKMLKQLGVEIESFSGQLPSMHQLAILFSVALQASSLDEGYRFIDDFYEEGYSLYQLLELIPKLLTEVGILSQVENNKENQEGGNPKASEEFLTLEEAIERYLEECLQHGLTEEQFYSMTLGEIKRYGAAIEPMKRQHLQDQSLMDYIQAHLIALNVGKIISSKQEVPDREEIYSFLYTKEELQKLKEEKERQREEHSRQAMQVGLLAWAEMLNHKKKDTEE